VEEQFAWEKIGEEEHEGQFGWEQQQGPVCTEEKPS